eukprot:COSAG01_NODE_123_length_25210_cov_348.799434_14_plen_532_part_00
MTVHPGPPRRPFDCAPSGPACDSLATSVLTPFPDVMPPPAQTSLQAGDHGAAGDTTNSAAPTEPVTAAGGGWGSPQPAPTSGGWGSRASSQHDGQPRAQGGWGSRVDSQQSDGGSGAAAAAARCTDRAQYRGGTGEFIGGDQPVSSQRSSARSHCGVRSGGRPMAQAMAAAGQLLLALLERADIRSCVLAHLGGDDLWRARRVCLGFHAACEAELRVLLELNLDPYHMKVTDAVVWAVATRCPQLASLSLDYCRSVTDAGLQAVAAGCRHLASLTLTECDQVTDEGVRAVAAGCPQLTALIFGHYTTVMERAQRLGLSFDSYTSVTDEGVRAVAAQCPQLTSLDLSHCNVTDEGVQAVGAGCLQLTSLQLTGCNVTDEGVRAVAAQCPQLTLLDLSDCNVTDEAVQAVVAGCPQLTSLDLSGCFSVTDAMVQVVAAARPQLKSLGLSHHVYWVTDEGVRAVVAACPQLTSLDLSGCESVTDEGVRAVAAACPQLTSLHLSGCKSVTDEGVRALKERGCDISLGCLSLEFDF